MTPLATDGINLDALIWLQLWLGQFCRAGRIASLRVGLWKPRRIHVDEWINELTVFFPSLAIQQTHVRTLDFDFTVLHKPAKQLVDVD